MLRGSLCETLPWVTPFRLKINVAFLCAVQVAQDGKSGCKVYKPACRGNCSTGQFVTGMGLSQSVPQQQGEGGTPARWSSPSSYICSLGWQWAGRTKVWWEVLGATTHDGLAGSEEGWERAVALGNKSTRWHTQTWASCSSRDLLRGRAFTQHMAEPSLPKQVKI